jgi:hypothetical protein
VKLAGPVTTTEADAGVTLTLREPTVGVGT